MLHLVIKVNEEADTEESVSLFPPQHFKSKKSETDETKIWEGGGEDIFN